MDETIASQLSEIVGENDITTSLLERKLVSHDAAPIPGLLTLFFKTIPDVVVRPENADEVARILCVALENKGAVIPRGAGSWSLGGVIPVKGGIVMDLVKMNRVGEISADGSLVEVGAGAIWKDLMEQLHEQGKTALSYPTSAPSSTVGGWISTGGYGIGSLKYGHIGEQIEAMEVVTPRGEILQVTKESADPGLGRFYGTEGQLGVISKATLRIRDLPEKTAARGVYVGGRKELAELVMEISRIKDVPYCLKVLDSGLMALRSELQNQEKEERNLILVEFEGSAEEVENGTGAFEAIVKRKGLEPIDEKYAEAKWEERLFPMRIARLGPTLLGGETVIPIEKLELVLSEIQALGKKYRIKIGAEAHIVTKEWAAILALYLADEREGLKYLTKLAVIRDIVHVGLSHGGKPYGLGLWDAIYGKEQFGKAYLKELESMKKELDPQGVLNPGKFFKAQTRFGIPITKPIYAMMMGVLSIACRIL
ncbi:MAG: FAD-binding oxidoreductase [Anaerolineales bacterium]|nr:FAD-binding oxidoreductase [Anaerolineales bacterium]